MLLLQAMQSAVLPFGLVLILGTVFQVRWVATVSLLLAVSSAWLWIRGGMFPLPPRAVDTIALVSLLCAGFLAVPKLLDRRNALLAAVVVLLTALLWSHRVLLPDWSAATWLLAVVLPLGAVAVFLWPNLSREQAANTGLVFLLYLPLVLSIGGSLLMGQLAGVLATSFAALWVLLQFNRIALPARGLLLLALLPGLLMLVVGWQFAEISLGALMLGLLLPGVYLALAKLEKLPQHWLARHAMLAVALAGQLAVGLWLVWPQQSLY